ncbi:MAG: ATP-binding cassette domain-containing protein [Mariprofundaceae bacterium]|nr:ATP-binding cassette domain-containing protein [Mariprofundaceae bacterium]
MHEVADNVHRAGYRLRMIQARQLMLRYSTGKTALSGVTLSIPKGRFVYLTGESGAGKSSLLRCLYGGARPTSGQLTVQDLDMRLAQEHQVRKLRRNIGVIFQDHRLLFSRTVFENVALPLRVQGWKPERLVARARKVLEFVGLEDRLWSFPEALSGGEQQRVAIARAMSTHPPLILADEPTGNLDIGTARRIMDYLMDLNRQGSTVVMATHDLQLMETHPGDLLCLHAGTLAEVLQHTPPTIHDHGDGHEYATREGI